MEITDIKDDNSLTKGVNEEEKGDTMMRIKLDKDKDKNDEININNTELNNMDTQNNYQDSSMKSDNKIKLNEDMIKQSKISTDKELISNDKENVNNKNEDRNEPIPAFGGMGDNISTKINRCFNEISIMIITIILLLYCLTLLTFSILDFIKRMNSKRRKKYFMNKTLFFILDIINISSILIYHIFNYYLKPKFAHSIILLLLIPLVICSILRCLQFAKKNDNMFAIIINLCQNLFACLINGLTLFYFFIDAKKRKNAMDGIMEIINFTELNANDKTKKDEGLQLDIISYNNNNKDKSSTSSEDNNNTTTTSNNEGN